LAVFGWEARIYPRTAEAGVVVWLAEELLLNADEVLNGRVNLAAVTARYVLVYSSGWVVSGSGGEKLARKLMLAVNYMAKLDWRVAGYSGTACIMEKPEHA
jgi:hypothetical protein